MNEDILAQIIRIAASGLSAFAGILLWSKTREGPWFIVIVSSVLFFVLEVYKSLVLFGIGGTAFFSEEIQMIFEMIGDSLPFVFLFVAFLVKLRQPPL